MNQYPFDNDPNPRRSFFRTSAAWAGSLAVGTGMLQLHGQHVLAQEPASPSGPTESPFERDYEAPGFKPSWKKPQINRQLAQDFIIYAHSDLEMTKKLLEREPGLINASIDWGAGDWETALGGASHMGRHEIVEFLLSRGARIDLFCAAMQGQTDAVRSFLTLQPSLIDAKGPHGFGLHFHAQVGGEKSKETLDYLQSVKEVELKPIPFLKKPAASEK
ncbi:MAG: ankyrin repeat domain-containing protein [Planctomycetaceae bacterium]|jgi:hypothetical protein|nr:ankyrin repeat domain-containing protein [Planctomycetaceae bacterium]